VSQGIGVQSYAPHWEGPRENLKTELSKDSGRSKSWEFLLGGRDVTRRHGIAKDPSDGGRRTVLRLAESLLGILIEQNPPTNPPPPPPHSNRGGQKTGEENGSPTSPGPAHTGTNVHRFP